MRPQRRVAQRRRVRVLGRDAALAAAVACACACAAAEAAPEYRGVVVVGKVHKCGTKLMHNFLLERVAKARGAGGEPLIVGNLEHKEFKPKNPVKALRCAADYWAAPRGSRKYCPPADWLELACNATLESGLADDGGGRAEDLKGLPSIVVETASPKPHYAYNHLPGNSSATPRIMGLVKDYWNLQVAQATTGQRAHFMHEWAPPEEDEWAGANHHEGLPEKCVRAIENGRIRYVSNAREPFSMAVSDWAYSHACKEPWWMNKTKGVGPLWGPHENETLCAVLPRLTPEEGVVFNSKEGLFGWALPQMVASVFGGGAYEMGVPHLVLRLERFASFAMASEAFAQFARFVTFADLDDSTVVSPRAETSILAGAAAAEQTAAGHGFHSEHGTHSAVANDSRRRLYEALHADAELGPLLCAARVAAGYAPPPAKWPCIDDVV